MLKLKRHGNLMLGRGASLRLKSAFSWYEPQKESNSPLVLLKI